MLKDQLRKTIEEFKEAYASKTKVAGYNIVHAHRWLILYPRIALSYAFLIVAISAVIGSGFLVLISWMFAIWFGYCAYKGLKKG